MSKNKRNLKFGLISIEAIVIFAIVLAIGVGGFFMSRSDVIHTQQKGGYTLSDKGNSLIIEEGSSTNIIQDLILTPEIARIEVGENFTATAKVIPQNLWTARLKWLPLEGGQRLNILAANDTLSASITGVSRGLAKVKVMADDGNQSYKTITVYVGQEPEFSKNFSVQSISTADSVEAIVSSNMSWDADIFEVSWKILTGAEHVTIQPNKNRAIITSSGTVGEAMVQATVLDKDFDRTYTFDFTVKIRNAWSEYSNYFTFDNTFKQKYNAALTSGELECNESTASRETWGNWSDWTTTNPGLNSATQEVVTATVYRTRTYGEWSTCNINSTWNDSKYAENSQRKNITRQVYQNWGDWSSWSTNNPGNASATKKVETTTMYSYRTLGQWSTCNDSSTWQDTAYTTDVGTQNATRTVYQNWGSWSNYSTTNPGTATSTMKVESKKQYCQSTRTANAWSSWQTSAITGNNDKEVETTTGYRYKTVGSWTTAQGSDVYASKTQYAKDPIVNRKVLYSYYFQQLMTGTEMKSEAVHGSTSNPPTTTNKNKCKEYGCAYFDYASLRNVSDLESSARVTGSNQSAATNASKISKACVIDYATACTDWIKDYGTSNSSMLNDGIPQFVYNTTAGDIGIICALRIQWNATYTVGGDMFTIDKDSATTNVGGIWIGNGTTAYAKTEILSNKNTFVSDAWDKIRLKQMKAPVADTTSGTTVAADTWFRHYVTEADENGISYFDDKWSDTAFDSSKAQITRTLYRNWSNWSDWSVTNPGTGTDEKKVETTTMYRSRTFSSWSACSSTSTWSDSKYSENNLTKNVERTVYRSKSVNTTWTTTAGSEVYASKTQYCKQTRAVGDWTSYSTTNPGNSSSTQEVRTATGYRYKAVDSTWTTTKGSEVYNEKTQYCLSTRTVGDWSSWTTTAASTTATQDAESATGYRYRNTVVENFTTASCQKRLDVNLINEINNPAVINIANGNLFGDLAWELPGYMKGQKVRVVYNATPANANTKLCVKIWNDAETWSKEICNATGATEKVDNSFTLSTNMDEPPSFTYKTNITTQANAGEVVGNVAQSLSQLSMSSTSSKMIIKYSLLQGGAWTGYGQNGDLVGTLGKDTTGVKITLAGEAANYYDITYSVFDEGKGWTDWAMSDEVITVTKATALKAKLVKKIDTETRIYVQVVNRYFNSSTAGGGGTIEGLTVAIDNE